MASFKAAQQYGLTPTVTPEYLKTARSPDEKGKQRIADALIAEEIAKKDKDFAAMWDSRRNGGEDAARKLLNYYTYGDPNGDVSQQPTQQADYQFGQQDALGYFDNPDDIVRQLSAQQGEGTRIPAAFSAEDQGKLMQEHPVLGTIAGAGKMAFNAGAGIVNIGKGIYDAASHPLQTIEGVARGVAGVGELAYEGITGKQVPEYGPNGPVPVADTKNQQVAKAVWDKVVMERYGSVDAAKKTLFEDPVGAIADIMTVIDGVGALKGIATAGKAGEASRAIEVAGKAGEVAKAEEATSAAGKLGKIVKSPFTGAKKITDTAGTVAKEVAGQATGAGRGAIDETLRTARFGTKEGRAAMAEGVRAGSIDEASALDDVIKNLEAARSQRAAQYQEKLAAFDGAKELLDGSPIANAVGDSLKSFKIMGRPGELNFDMASIPKGTPAAAQIEAYVNELFSWGTQPGQNFDVLGFDTLKKRLGEVFPTEPKAKAFAAPIQDAVIKVLNKVDGYTEMTNEYAKMTELLNDVKSTLSVGGRASRDTAIKKLTNLLKNNNEHKAEVLRALLQETGDTTTLPKMAGVAMSAKTPRGLAGTVGATAVTLSAFDMGRLAGRLAGFIAASPRAMHEFLKAIGFTQRQVDKIIEMGRKTGLNKVFSDENIGRAAELSRPSESARKKIEADKLFMDEPGQNK